VPGFNFTEDVRQVLARAREEANRLQHEYVGTEHILLGFATKTGTRARDLLEQTGARPDQVRATIDGIVRPGQSPEHRDLPYTTRAKKIFELAMTEARVRHHDHVGIEHLLLGLIREEKGIAAQVLAQQGVRAESVQISGGHPDVDGIEHQSQGELTMLPPQGDYVHTMVHGGGRRMHPGVVLALSILWAAFWIYLQPEVLNWRLLGLIVLIIVPPLLLWRFTR
jgi:ATP-dependent Clp protease ATP-binding subunit ClpC